MASAASPAAAPAALEQLEQELEANAWISIEPDHELIFLSENEPAWKQAIAKLGIDPGQLASVGGHAGPLRFER